MKTLNGQKAAIHGHPCYKKAAIGRFKKVFKICPPPFREAGGINSNF